MARPVPYEDRLETVDELEDDARDCEREDESRWFVYGITFDGDS